MKSHRPSGIIGESACTALLGGCVRIDKLRDKQSNYRAETLAEISRLRAMTENKHIQRGFDSMIARLRYAWTKKCSVRETPEQRSARFQEEQRPTLHGVNRSKKWTKADEVEVLNTDIPDVDLALKLGRTTKAIRRKRQNLMTTNT